MAMASASAKSKARSCRPNDFCPVIASQRGAHLRDPLARNDAGESSALLRRNIPKPCRMRGDIVETKGQVNALVRRRSFFDRHAGPPFPCRPDRPRDKTAAAVRADIAEFALDAIRAERALVGAHARFHGGRWHILVPLFAVQPKWQRHGRLMMSNRAGSSQIRRETRMTNLPRFRPYQIPAISVIPGLALR